MAGLEVVPFSDEHLDDAAGSARRPSRPSARGRADCSRSGSKTRPRPARRSRRRGACRAPRVRRRPGTAAWSATCSAPRARARSGARTCGSSSRATRSRSPRICVTCTPLAAARWVEQGRTRQYALVPYDRAGSRRRVVPRRLRSAARAWGAGGRAAGGDASGRRRDPGARHRGDRGSDRGRPHAPGAPEPLAGLLDHRAADPRGAAPGVGATRWPATRRRCSSPSATASRSPSGR